jgi:NADP-dependent 3-hydroxy acid dehydrogenase YdfG
MANIAKTLIATGCSSGLGFELIKQLLTQSQPHKIILGARNTNDVEVAYNNIEFDKTKHSLSIFPLDLSDLKGTKIFAEQTLQNLGNGRVDCLLLNAGMIKSAEEPESWKSKWSEQYVVNHLCEYLASFNSRIKLIVRRDSTSLSHPLTQGKVD